MGAGVISPLRLRRHFASRKPSTRAGPPHCGHALTGAGVVQVGASRGAVASYCNTAAPSSHPPYHTKACQ